jgi:trimeric autotransporter adhesin
VTSSAAPVPARLPAPAGWAPAWRPGRRAALATFSLLAGLAALGSAPSLEAPALAVAPPSTEVTNTLDFGPGSLRKAILTSNTANGRQTISFKINGSGSKVITPRSDLPQITGPVTIDGYTQSGARAATATAVAAPKVVIDGQNLTNGLVIESSDNVIRGLVIHSVPGYGAAIFVSSGARNVIAGNYLGTGVDGQQAFPNYVGVYIQGEPTDTVVGGPRPADRNLISANRSAGVQIDAGPGNNVEGNRIGTNATGTAALSSSAGYINGYGVLLESSGNTVRDNQVANMSDGLEVWGDDNILQGNLIGTDDIGKAAIPNDVGMAVEGGDRNQVGGTRPGEGNVISGSRFWGLSIEAGEDDDSARAVGNLVLGNKIGTDAAGTKAVPNGSLVVSGSTVPSPGVQVYEGSTTIGGAEAGAGNVISGNTGDGVQIVGAEATGIKVLGNLIGTDVTGTQPLANGASGVEISTADGSTVGGVDPGEANTIAYNGGDGVTVAGGSDNAILANSIHHNDALGIDLGGDGVTPNDAATALDADTGGNDLQNFPVIAGVTTSGGQTTIDWTLDSLALRSFQIEFFTGGCDGSRHGEGETYLGSTRVITGADGHASDSTPVATTATGAMVTATATSGVLVPITSGGFGLSFRPDSTSEFSACVNA